MKGQGEGYAQPNEKAKCFPCLAICLSANPLSIGTHRAISTKVTGGGFKSINFQQVIFV